jgi:hypothetical protein
MTWLLIIYAAGGMYGSTPALAAALVTEAQCKSVIQFDGGARCVSPTGDVFRKAQ